jgi:hypothetical protein
MAVTTFEKGMQAGLQQAVTTFEKGLREGRRTTLQEQLEARFGPLSPGAQQRLESLSPDRLQALTLEPLRAQSLHELDLEG